MSPPARRLLATVALLLLFAPAAVRADDFDPQPIDAIVQKAVAEFHVPGAAVVVVKGDRVVYLKGFGVKKHGADAAVTPDTVFAIASCSKAFTATAAAMLVADGKLGWDDPVRKHLPAFRLSDPAADHELTVRDLLCHRTGMPRHDALWFHLSTDTADVFRRYGLAPRSTSLRSAWEYANVPFTAAGVIVGKAGDGDWAATVRKRIFTPLGMTSASCTSAEARSAADHAIPHYRTLAGSALPIDWDDIDHIGGAGCVNASVRDMGQWLRFQLAGGRLGEKRLVSAKALKETHTPQVVVRHEGRWAVFYPEKTTKFLTYGLGWFVHDYRGRKAVSHGGTLSGFRSQLMMIPDEKVGVFAVANLQPSYFPEAACRGVLDHLLGESGEDWVAYYRKAEDKREADEKKERDKRAADRKKDTKPSKELTEYAGKYEDPAYGRAEVAAKDGKLEVRWANLTLRLEHYHYDTFSGTVTDPADQVPQYDRTVFDVQFRLGIDGEVESMRFLDQDFRRTPPAKKKAKDGKPTK